MTVADVEQRWCDTCAAITEWRRYGKTKAGKTRNWQCYACQKATHRRQGARLRARRRQGVLNAYGRRCVCCGETTEAFLCIDHINGGGTKHRRETRTSGWVDLYRWLEDNGYPPGFQILCWNCNAAKHFLGQCPHQAGKGV